MHRFAGEQKCRAGRLEGTTKVSSEDGSHREEMDARVRRLCTDQRKGEWSTQMSEDMTAD